MDVEEQEHDAMNMMMAKDVVARSNRLPTDALGNDGGLDLEGRKRRILRRGTISSAASPASQTAMVEAGSIQRASKGRHLLTQGDTATSVAILGLGRARLLRTLNNGQSLSLGYRGAGDLLGDAALAGVAIHRESAIATEDVEVLMIPLPTIKTILANDPAFAAAVIGTLVDRCNDTEERLASMLFRNVEARVCEFLLKAAVRWGIPDPRGVLIGATFTHQEMASIIGSTRETVTLTLGDLRRKNIIEIDRRRIVILDRDALRSRI